MKSVTTIFKVSYCQFVLYGFTLCVFQMSTTTENGMGGPRNTSREKTYKKVKKNKHKTNCSYKSLTVCVVVFYFYDNCEHVSINIYFGKLLFRANKPKGLHLWVTWVLVNVLLQDIMSCTLWGPGARDQSSAAGHTCFLWLFFIHFGRQCTWQHFLTRHHYKTLHWSYRLGLKIGQRCFCGDSESIFVAQLVRAACLWKLHHKVVPYRRCFFDLKRWNLVVAKY